MPSTSEARPSRCCGCGAASRPPGANLVVHGDGTRERQVRGPASAQDEPQLGTVRVRRFECQLCGACMIVVPRELLPRRLYTASAIGLALALWSLMGGTEVTTRKRVSPFAIVGAAAASRWMTLRRWATDAGTGRLSQPRSMSRARAAPGPGATSSTSGSEDSPPLDRRTALPSVRSMPTARRAHATGPSLPSSVGLLEPHVRPRDGKVTDATDRTDTSCPTVGNPSAPRPDHASARTSTAVPAGRVRREPREAAFLATTTSFRSANGICATSSTNTSPTTTLNAITNGSGTSFPSRPPPPRLEPHPPVGGLLNYYDRLAA
jgi:hypothetical protein